jgi:protein ImuB
MLCVWLPRFLTDRLSRTLAPMSARRETLLAVTASGKGGNRLIAVNEDAQAAGLRPGMLLTDATAIAPELRASVQNAREEDAHLRRLALWCRRYTPWAEPDVPDGIRLDISGCAHLFGGEAELLRDLRRRFAQAGFACRAAIASTPGAAWGMARFAPKPLSLIPQGEERARLAPLSVRALRIGADRAASLETLGLKTVGQLVDLPRQQLRARFGAALCTQIDRALGLEREALDSLQYQTIYNDRIDFAEPISTLPAIELALTKLVHRLAPLLRRDGKGARSFTLYLFDMRGESTDLDLALARPSHDPAHILRLFRERFTVLEGRFAGDTAFDAIVLQAGRVETLTPAQSELIGEIEDVPDLGPFLDRLRARLGETAVRRLAFRESHLPERAAGSVPILHSALRRLPPRAAPRPFLLLPHPEEISAMAELPDYPPRRFTWRRVRYLVVKAQGPEQIAGEWWRGGDRSVPIRDYYAVEVETGRRFWIFREGLYDGEGAPPRWFLHGILP